MPEATTPRAQLPHHRISTWHEVALRRGPYALLGLATVLSVISADLFDRAGTVPWMLALAAVAAALHLVCVDVRWGRPLDDAVGHLYVGARLALAFVLSWVNPFFAVYAVTGYFDAHLHLKQRWQTPALLGTALTLAGSQSGGFPPTGWLQGVAFAGLFGLNAGLALFFGRVADHEAELASQRDDTIRQLEEALAENNRLHQQVVEHAREAGVRAERERLAVEIHDTIAQNLTGIVTQLQAAEEAADLEESRRHQQRAAALAREALGEARRSVQGLVPERLTDSDLHSALSALAEEWSTATGIHAEVVVTGDPEPLHPDIGATVLRVAQESLANVGKHAAANRVGVTLSYMDDELALDVRDDGVGFDPSAVVPTRDHGVGLLGMRHRALRLAGVLSVESEPGLGTAVSLRVPSVARG